MKWKSIFQIGKPNAMEGDGFIRRIRSLVIGEGMLNEGNIDLMNFAVKNMPEGGHVVEIGSYGGLSTNLIIYLMQRHHKNQLFFTCDAWVYEGYADHLQQKPDTHIDGRTDISRAAYADYIKNAFINSTTLLSAHHLPFSFHQFSSEFFECWKNRKYETDVFGRSVQLGGNISFAYIDGGHAYEVAWQDFNNIAMYLLPGGYMLLDDSADGSSMGSARMMVDIKQDKRFKVIAKNPNYLIQKVG